MWSLGIILFELCKMQRPFNSDNLLSLVFKIVKEKMDPIPDTYSSELQELVNFLLHKADIKRP